MKKPINKVLLFFIISFLLPFSQASGELRPGPGITTQNPGLFANSKVIQRFLEFSTKERHLIPEIKSPFWKLLKNIQAQPNKALSPQELNMVRNQWHKQALKAARASGRIIRWGQTSRMRQAFQALNRFVLKSDREFRSFKGQPTSECAKILAQNIWNNRAFQYGVSPMGWTPRWGPKNDPSFHNNHKNWFFFKGTLRWTRILAVSTASLMIANLAYQDEVVTNDEYLYDPRFRLKRHQVRIINVMTPFPHTAIQIGSKVYEFNRERVDNTFQSLYFMNKSEYQPQFSETGPSVGEFLGQKIEEAVYSIDRSYQTITLNLTEQDTGKLVEFFESHRGKTWLNNTVDINCNRMIEVVCQHVGCDLDVPPFIDSSPGWSLSWLAAVKTTEELTGVESPLVHSIVQVELDNSEGSTLHSWRNAFINSLDAKFFIHGAPYVAGLRFSQGLDMDGLVYGDEQLNKELKEMDQYYSSSSQEQAENGLGLKYNNNFLLLWADRIANTPKENRQQSEEVALRSRLNQEKLQLESKLNVKFDPQDRSRINGELDVINGLIERLN